MLLPLKILFPHNHSDSDYCQTTITDNKGSMICKHCENSGVTVDDQQGTENASPSTSNLFTELENLENTITRLKSKRCDLKRDINRRHSSFIRIIPLEIIARIFKYANTDVTITGSGLPILLSSVCSDWRRAVVGTPELWSSIKIDLPPISQISNNDMDESSMLPRLATFIDEWLARSGQLPLNISLYSEYETPWPGYSSAEYLPIFNTLNKYSSRWRSLNISIPTILHQLLQPNCLPLLEQLHITGSNKNDLTFPHTPSLNTVEIHPQAIMNSEFQIEKIRIQWNTVTHVFLEFINSSDCFTLLRLNPQLVHCTFHEVTDDIDDDDIEEFEFPIICSLTYLSLHNRRCTAQILDYVTLPHLKTLVMFNVIIEPVISVIKRSACSLHTLSLLNWNNRKTDKLMTLLEFLSPSLTRLSISRPPSPIRGTKNYLSILTQIYTSQSEVAGNNFLPHLEVFEYREESPSTLESSMLSLSTNLPSRNYPMSASTSISLRSAYISKATIVNKEVPQAISVILQRLEEDGILIYS